MFRRFSTCLLLAILLMGGAVQPASAREICFPDQPDITACFADPFSAYWEENGGLPVFGYPLNNARQERNPDLNVDLLTQWTERNRLEVHPQNRPPFNILLGRMGAERLAQMGRPPALEGREPGPQPGCLWFETTGHNVCDQTPGRGFKTYWETHGLKVPGLDAYGRSLQLFGLPLTTPRMETNASGDTVLTQWFERARFEWHPQKPDPFKVLLGLLGNELRQNPSTVAPPSVFGAEILRGSNNVVLSRAAEAAVSWTRYSEIMWSEVEPVRGQRDWSKLARLENDLRRITELGITPMVIVKGTPTWAQKVPGVLCGPIRADALDAFASFMREVVSRYSGPPYNVRYWELGNEPDIDPALVKPDSGFGCWGDASDPYYGGGYYAEMLKRVYPVVKQVNPSAQIVIGGLLLDCDPTRPRAGQTCQPAKFYEGILRNGGGNAFDVVAYHAYTYWSPSQIDWDLEHVSWNHRGGALLGKLDFLRTVQAQYGVNKPILMNEGGLLCHPSVTACPSDAFYAGQANYVVRLYTRTWSRGLLGSVWYYLNGPGWREGGLLDRSQAPRPAYTTFKFLANLLKGASYDGALSRDGVEGYAFRKGSMVYRIYWSNSAAVTTIALPAGTQTVYNVAGQPISTNGTNVRVGFDPIIIESRTP
jgi:hypothetical protein